MIKVPAAFLVCCIFFYACFPPKQVNGPTPKTGVFTAAKVSHNPISGNSDTVFYYQVTLLNDTLHGPCRFTAGKTGYVESDTDYGYASVVKGSAGWTTGSYKKGKKDGWWKLYAPNGQLASVETFQDGKKEGCFLKFDPDTGDTLSCVFYKNDVKNGPHTSLYPYYYLNYTAGKLDGLQQFSWSSSPNIGENAMFNKGALISYTSIQTPETTVLTQLDNSGTGTITLQKYSLGLMLLGQLAPPRGTDQLMPKRTDESFSGIITLKNGFLTADTIQLYGKYSKVAWRITVTDSTCVLLRNP